MSSLDASFVEIFLEELDLHLDSLESNLLSMDTGGKGLPKEALRILHTLKSDAGFLKLDKLESLWHYLEEKALVDIDAQSMSLEELSQRIYKLTSFVHQCAQDRGMDGLKIDFPALAQEYWTRPVEEEYWLELSEEHLLVNDVVPGAKKVVAEEIETEESEQEIDSAALPTNQQQAKADIDPSTLVLEEKPATDDIDPATLLFEDNPGMDEADPANLLIEEKSATHEADTGSSLDTEVIESLPSDVDPALAFFQSMEPGNTPQICEDSKSGKETRESAGSLKDIVLAEPSEVEPTHEEPEEDSRSNVSVKLEGVQEQAISEKVSKKTSTSSPRQRTGTEKVDVEIAQLSNLVDLASDLVLIQNRLGQILDPGELQTSQTSSVYKKLRHTINELKSEILASRLVPFRWLYRRVPPMIEDLEKKLKKQVRLVFEGGDVEIEKTLLEALSDPLIHIVRNVMDHAIEDPQTRIANGKNPQGLLRFHVFQEESNVILEIIDDGAGVDPDKVSQKALEKGLISEEELMTMSVPQRQSLIFRPGFSTREQTTSVSGRGVGMDVVMSSLKSLGGAAVLNSTPGKGTRLRLVIPFNLAIEPMVLIQAGGFPLALAQSAVREIQNFTEADHSRIHKIAKHRFIEIRGEYIPLFELDSLLNKRSGIFCMKPKMKLLLCKVHDKKLALLCDRIDSIEEVVIRPLPVYFSSQTNCSGCCILSDATIAMVLDLAGFSNKIEIPARKVDRPEVESEALKSQEDLFIARTGENKLVAAPSSRVLRVYSRRELKFYQSQDGVSAVVLDEPDSILSVLRWEELEYEPELEAGSGAVQFDEEVIEFPVFLQLEFGNSCALLGVEQVLETGAVSIVSKSRLSSRGELWSDGSRFLLVPDFHREISPQVIT